MTDLVTLRQKQLDAQKEYECWAMQNTYGKTPAEMAEIDLGYRRAERRYVDAMREYEVALQSAT